MHPERAVRKVTTGNDVDRQPSHSIPGLGRVRSHSLGSSNIWGGVPHVSAGVGPHIIRSPRNPVSSTDGGGKLAVSLSVAKVIKPTMRAFPRQRPVTEKWLHTHTHKHSHMCPYRHLYTFRTTYTHIHDHSLWSVWAVCWKVCCLLIFLCFCRLERWSTVTEELGASLRSAGTLQEIKWVQVLRMDQ